MTLILELSGDFKITELIFVREKNDMRQPQKSSVAIGNFGLLFRDSFFEHFD